MSIVSTAVALAMAKHASYASLAKGRNHTPPRPERPVTKKEETGNYTYKANDTTGKGNELIRWGRNEKNNDTYLPLTERRTLDFHNTISGTGHGRPYWADKENPYEAT